MALSLAFELRVEERGEHRVVVSVLLAPGRADGDVGARIDGVVLELMSRTNEPLGVRMVLPIAGELRQPMLSTVELKMDGPIPLGCRVVGTAWHGADQREASIPTDPFTELEVHMQARRRILAADAGRELERVSPEERARIAKDFPWIDTPRLPVVAGNLVVDEDADLLDADDDGVDGIDDLVGTLGLDEESTEWLKELLNEDELGDDVGAGFDDEE